LTLLVKGALITTGSNPVFTGFHQSFSWTVGDSFGPTASETSSIMYLYHALDTSSSGSGVDTGLVGPLLITRQGSQTSIVNPTPLDVNKEFILLFNIFDENKSYLINQNIANYTSGSVNVNDPAFIDSNRKRSINGWMYNNLAVRANPNDTVRWYVASIGDVDGIHAPQWTGQVVTNNGQAVSTLNVLPYTSTVADIAGPVPGTWSIQSGVPSYRDAGMIASLGVAPIIPVSTSTSAATSSTGVVATSSTTSTTGGSDIKHSSGNVGSLPAWALTAIIVGIIVLAAAIVTAVVVYKKGRRDRGPV